MFKRPHHQLVQQVLSALNADFLRENKCYFGGGTRIVMELDEYRESLDIDLLCADSGGYRSIRSTVSEHSLGSLLSKQLPLAREVRADRYGIRTFFDVDGAKIKFEIVSEGRINLEAVNLDGLVIPALDRVSCFAEKLLANADRWGDKSVMSRDIIDIAFMVSHWGVIPQEAFVKAENAYGSVIHNNLENAATLLQDDPIYRAHCIDALDVSDRERLQAGLEKIREQIALSKRN
jgi:hypothetical protein